MNNQFSVPILFLIFNRPVETLSVFNAIRDQRPTQLYIAADGPRPHRPEDAVNCSKTREIINLIDWDCQVKTLFRDENLGCGKAVSGAITWFFDQVEEGIILEDDCLPNSTFFLFCKESLEKYRHNDKVMHIAGSCLLKSPATPNSYYFSKYSLIWGWATWRRAWLLYDFSLLGENNYIDSIENTFLYKEERNYWLNIFKLLKQGRIDTWDYQWNFSIWKNKGLCIIPNYNMISNIGFGGNGTHTVSNSKIANLDTVSFEFHHPDNFIVDHNADKYLSKLYGVYFNLFPRILNMYVKKIAKNIFIQIGLKK